MTGTLRPGSQFQVEDVVRLKKGSPDLEVRDVQGVRVLIRWPDDETLGTPEAWIDAHELELATRVGGIASEEWEALRWRTMKPEARRAYRAYAMTVMEQGEKDPDEIDRRAKAMLEREFRRFGEF